MAFFPKALAVLALVLAAALPAALATDKCTYPQNYGITIDHSGSVNDTEYGLEKGFVVDFVTLSNVPGSKYLITSFASAVATNDVADSFNSPTLNVTKAVEDYPRPGGGSTAIGTAIANLMTRMMAAGVTKAQGGLLVVVTDGAETANSNPVGAANTARSNGFRVLAVGVGDGIDRNQLQQVADPGLFVEVGSGGFAALKDKLNDVIQRACCINVCSGGRTSTTNQCNPPAPTSWTPCKSCTTNSLVLQYAGAKDTCLSCQATGPDGLDRCFWCVTNALTLAKGKTGMCACCDKVANCYNTLENSLVNQKGWERYVLRCKEKFTSTAEQDSCFWCLTNALTTDPKTCTQDTFDFCSV